VSLLALALGGFEETLSLKAVPSEVSAVPGGTGRGGAASFPTTEAEVVG